MKGAVHFHTVVIPLRIFLAEFAIMTFFVVKTEADAKLSRRACRSKPGSADRFAMNPKSDLLSDHAQ